MPDQKQQPPKEGINLESWGVDEVGISLPLKKLKELDLLKLVLPEGLLDYFDVSGIEIKEGQYQIFLAEKNIHPEQYKNVKLTSKGFFDEITVQDFPIRGKACYLKIKRRKWLNEETGQNVSRDWKLVALGTRMTEEFALFLKRAFWIQNL